MYEKFERLLKDRKISTYKVCKETGLSKSMFSHWKAGRYVPKIDKIKVLADYFGVPIEYFLEE